MTTLHSAACRQQRRPLLYFNDTIMPHEELKQPSLVRSSSIAKNVNGARPQPLLKNFLRWAFTATILLVFIHSTVFSSGQHLRHPEQLVDHAIHARMAAAAAAATCRRDYSDAASWPDLVRRTAWTATRDRCHTSKNDDCQCANPWKPTPRVIPWANWTELHERNVNLVQAGFDTVHDVVLLGDSITEGWMGTWFFKHFFGGSSGTDDSTSPLQGLALGIQSDRTSQLYYRLFHGEGAARSRVYWVTIGLNDIYADCTVEMVVVGILQIAETLLVQSQHGLHNVTVVLNSILPSGSDRLNTYNSGWQRIRTVNHALECYATTRPALHSVFRSSSSSTGNTTTGTGRVEFFNATDYFVTKPDGEFVNATLLGDMVHPSQEGYLVWGSLIVQRVQEILGRNTSHESVSRQT
jgi:hypothetical protein